VAAPDSGSIQNPECVENCPGRCFQSRTDKISILDGLRNVKRLSMMPEDHRAANDFPRVRPGRRLKALRATMPSAHHDTLDQICASRQVELQFTSEAVVEKLQAELIARKPR